MLAKPINSRQAATVALSLLLLVWCYARLFIPISSSLLSETDNPPQPPQPPPPSPPPPSPKPTDRPLILYVYAEAPPARQSLNFFISQGLHSGADFVFIINGETNATDMIPTGRPNIRTIRRNNTCYDLGAYGEVLRKDDLYMKYTRFILLNASIRGPFLPTWSKDCWSDVFLRKITEDVKLVGITGNCWPRFHVQSMIWATDRTGLSLLLNPPSGSSQPDIFGGYQDAVALEGCYDSWGKAVHAEIGATSAITSQGYSVDLMMTAFRSLRNYPEECDPGGPIKDVFWQGGYFGFNVHPYETMFIKGNRNIDPVMIERLTEWHLAMGSRSEETCGDW